jgi:hypothetical protein
MRVEGQDRRLLPILASGARNFAQQLVVPCMDAVEVPDGHCHRLERGGFL